jgi:hypothetical protein
MIVVDVIQQAFHLKGIKTDSKELLEHGNLKGCSVRSVMGLVSNIAVLLSKKISR